MEDRAPMNKVDLTILRLAVYEMRYDGDIPEKVGDQRGGGTF